MYGEASSVFRQFKNNLLNQSTEGIGISILLILVLIIISANIFRIIEKGFVNYNVFISERDLLNKEQARNDELKEVLEYYQSPETKEILARDVLNLAAENEIIYQTKNEPLFYEEKIQLLEIEEIKPNKSQWLELLPF